MIAIAGAGEKPAPKTDTGLPAVFEIGASELAHYRAFYGSDRTGLERAVADHLFVSANRAKGALIPFGFGFLSPAAKVPWIEQARANLAVGEGNA